MYGETFANDPDLLKSQAVTKEQMDSKFLQDILTVMNKAPEKEKEKLRQTYQTSIIKALLNSEKIPDEVKGNNSNLFLPYMRQTISGSGARRKGKMLFVKGGSYAINN